MRSLLHASLAAALLLWPVMASAVPPPISGVVARYEDGKVHVEWEAPANTEDIARYNVYFGRRSIIGNDGAFDDFEAVSGNATELDLLPPAGATRVFVGVLAEDIDGGESATFGSEVAVDIPPNTAARETPPATAAPTTDSLRLLSARPLSQTGILLLFSLPTTIAQQDAASAFRLSDASGATLAIRTIAPQGQTVMLTTAPMREGIRYTVRAFAVWSAPDAAGNRLLVDAQANSASFIAGELIGPLPTPPTAPPPAEVPVSFAVALRAQPTAQNEYHVTADLQVQKGAEKIASFEVTHSTDGGRTFDAPQTLAASTRTIQFDRVPAGDFAVLVKAQTTDGRTVMGTQTATEIRPVTPQPQPAPTNGLPGSGAGLALIVIASGAAAGWRRVRRMRK